MSFWVSNGSISIGGNSISVNGGNYGSNYSRPKNSWGRETVSHVNTDTSATLSGTTVTGNAKSGTSFNAVNAVVHGDTKSGTSLSITGGTFKGFVKSGTSLTAISAQLMQGAKSGTSMNMQQITAPSAQAGTTGTVDGCTIPGRLESGTGLYATACDRLGQVIAGTSATILDCSDVGSVQASTDLSLENVKVHGNAVAGTVVEVARNSTITKTLECANEKLLLENCDVGKLLIKAPGLFSEINGPITIAGMGCFSGGSISIGRYCGNSVQVGGKNISVPYGCSIKIAGNQLWVNGQRYQEPRSCGQTAEKVEQVVEIRGGRVGDIVFEEGNGKVVLTESAQLDGTVIGGVVIDSERAAKIKKLEEKIEAAKSEIEKLKEQQSSFGLDRAGRAKSIAIFQQLDTQEDSLEELKKQLNEIKPSHS